MGCQLSKEEAKTIQEQESENLDFESSIPDQNYVEELDQVLETQLKEKEPTGTPPAYSILDRIKETKSIDPKKPEEVASPEIETIKELMKHSPPEFGFSQVEKTIVTGNGFTPGALRNVLTISEHEEDDTLTVCVYSVKKDSIEFEFFNKFRIEPDLNQIEPPIHYLFDCARCKLLIFHSQNQLCELKLEKNKTVVEDAVKLIELQAQTDWIKVLTDPLTQLLLICNKPIQFRFQLLKENKNSTKTFFYELCRYNDIQSLKSCNFFARPHLTDDIRTLFLGDVRRGSTESGGTVMRPALFYNINISSLLEKQPRNVKESSFVGKPSPYSEAKIVQFEEIRPGVAFILTSNKYYIFLCIINLTLKKVIKQYFQMTKELAEAYYQKYVKKGKASGLGDFLSEIDSETFVDQVFYDHSTNSLIIGLLNIILKTRKKILKCQNVR